MAQLQTTAVTGSLTVTGNITAQTLVVQTITSSISVVTGSTQFGSLTSNTHQFTGSILQSGSLAYFAGSVGIGTASPGDLLHIGNTTTGGNLRVVASSYGNNGLARFFGTDNGEKLQIGALGSSQAFIFTPASVDLAIYAGNSERLRITSGGNLGIGTTSPGAKLQVIVPGGLYNASITTQADLTGSVIIQADSSGTNSRASLIMRGSDSIGGAISVAREDTGATWKTYMSFYTNNSTGVTTNAIQEKMRINSDGNVGIGTTSPARKLDVNGTSIFRDFTTVVATNGNAVSNITWLSTDSGIMNIYTGGSSTIQLNSNGVSYINGGSVGIGTTSPASTYVLDVRGGNILFNNANVNVVAKDTGTGYATYVAQSQNGSGGILDLAAQGSTANSLMNGAPANAGIVGMRGSHELHLGTGATSRMMINTSGNVGIGTTSPAVTLQVDASSGGLIRVTRTSAGSGYAQLESDGTNGSLTANNTLYVNAGGSTRMTVLSGGNVGIGTTNPSFKLEVNGNIWASDYYIQNTLGTSGTFRIDGYQDYLYFYGDTSAITGYRFGSDTAGIVMQINTNGNVGIGTTSPNSQLDAYTSQGGSRISATHGTGGSYPKASGISFGATSTSLTVSNNGSTVTFTGGAGIYANNSAASNNPTDLVFWTTSGGSPAEKMRITSGGSVGIGVTAPSRELHIKSSDGAQIMLEATSVGSWNGIQLSSGNGTYSAYFGQNDADGRFFIDNASNGDDFVITQGGNIGIGTTSPSFKLDVQGNAGGITINTNGAISSGTEFIAGSGIFASNSSGTDVAIKAGATTLMTLKNSGYIGIGTTAPREKLQIVGNTVIGNSGLNSYKTNLYLTYSAGTDETWVRIYVPQDYVSSNNGGTIRVRVLWEGDHATFGAYQDYQVSYKTFYPSSPYLKFSNVLCMNKTSDFVTGATYYPPSSTPDVLFYDNSDGYLYVKIKGTNASYNTARYIEAEIFGRTTAQPTITTTTAPGSPSELTKTIQFLPQEGNIYASGCVGIGTTSPQRRLSVSGSIILSGPSSAQEFIIGDESVRYFSLQTPSGAANLQFNVYGGSNIMTLLSGGNVGIGTTSPATALQVNGTARATRVNATGGTVDFDAATGNNFISVSSGNMSIANNGTVNVYISGSGNVGIGTTSPTAKLVVVEGGASGAPLMTFIGNASNGNYMRTSWVTSTLTSLAFLNVEGSTALNFGAVANMPLNLYTNNSIVMTLTGGNVGIGTTSPSATLAVSKAASNYMFDLENASEVAFKLRTYNGGTSNGSATPAFIYGLYYGTTENAAIRFYRGGGGTDGFLSFTTTGTERLRIDSNGNVGIGTTDPNYKLRVEGTLYASSTARFAGVLFSDSRLMVGAAGSDQTYANVFIAGALTTGTNQYALLLDPQLAGTTNYGLLANARIKASTAVTTAYGIYVINNELLSGASIVNNYGIYIANQTNGSSVNYALFSAGGLNYFGGNVGIGTTSPGTLLDVSGSANIYNRLDVGTGLDWPLGVSNAIATFKQSNSTGGVIIQETGNASFDRVLKLNSNGDEQSIESTYRDTGPYGNLVFKTGGSERMRITSGGNVGIGTTNPVQKLHVEGSAAIGTTGTEDILLLGRALSGGVSFQQAASLKLGRYQNAGGAYESYTRLDIALRDNSAASNYNTNTTVMTLTNAGNVGIGTTAPRAALDVTGSGNAIVIGDGSVGGSLYFGAASTANSILYAGGEFQIRTNQGSGINFYTQGTAFRVRIDDAGNVGIGTTAPGYKLHVAGTGYFGGTVGFDGEGNGLTVDTGYGNNGRVGLMKYGGLEGMLVAGNTTTLRLGHRTDSDYVATAGSPTIRVDLFIATNGNVGIGTTTASYKLDVSGTIRATGDVIAYSDARIKENVNTITDALTKVTSLRGVSYTRKDSEDKSRKVGVIAQEVLDILPEVVQQDDSGNYSVAYGNIVGVLIEAIKELKAEINELKNK